MLRIGTCSWTERTLLESREFYPAGVRTAEERLRYYSGHFNVVEVDSTYYAIPKVRNSELWSERTPPDFIFHIKVFGALTGHGVGAGVLPPHLRPGFAEGRQNVFIRDRGVVRELARIFIDSIDPLARTKKLGLLVFQYPPWFVYSNENVKYISFCREITGRLNMGVEFRHGSWLLPDRAENVFAFLRDNGIVYITADEPQYGGIETVPNLLDPASDIVYMRLHGRNRENWFKKGLDTALRYSYLYNRAELEGFAGMISPSVREEKQVYMMFNNCHGGMAVRNSLDMLDIMRDYEA